MYKTYNPYVVALSATVGGMLFGFDISSISAFVDNENYREFFNYPNDITQGGITASMAGGSFLGSLASGFVSDRLGRKKSVQIGAMIWIIGAAIQCSVQNLAQLICGRVISGVAIGICSSQVPVYIAELSPKKIRGRLVGLFQWAVTWGITIMFYISYGCTFMNGSSGFRTAWGIQMVPGFVLFFVLFILPESPRWLASKDRWDEAEYIISRVQGRYNKPAGEKPVEGAAAAPTSGDPAEYANDYVQLEMQEIREAVRIERESADITLLDLFRKDSIARTMTGIWAQIWQQMTGMNVMMYYVVYTFAMAGYTGNSGLISSSIQYVINVVMTIPALLFIDSWGRRRLLISGAILQAMWLFLVGGLMGKYGHWVPSVNGNESIRWSVPNKHAAKAVIAFNYLFVATFAPTWGPGSWVYVSEIFPLKQRALANGVCAAANWIFNFALAFFVPPAFKNIQWKTYIIFGVFCLCMALHVFLLFPETKGKTLEEIDLIWEQRVPAWKSSKTDFSQFALNRDLTAAPTKAAHGHKEYADEQRSDTLSA
ncbi:general substrate transporter [Dipodascopsis tothii]|uniref:general substrate transporter n=1 Tax=Dipodascopsis tothii TaxID=44089 RepID=UPI0034CF1CD6